MWSGVSIANTGAQNTGTSSSLLMRSEGGFSWTGSSLLNLPAGLASSPAVPDSCVTGSQVDLSCNMLFPPKPVWGALQRYQIIRSLSELHSCSAFWSLWQVAAGRVGVPPWVGNVFRVPVYQATVNDNGKLWTMWQKAKIFPVMWRCLCSNTWMAFAACNGGDTSHLDWEPEEGFNTSLLFSPGFLMWFRSQFLFLTEEKQAHEL